MIDFAFPRVGTCRKCGRDATVYPTWDKTYPWICKPCSGVKP